MMKKQLIYILLLTIGCVLGVCSCKSSKSATERATISAAEDKLEHIVEGYGDWKSVTVSGKVAVSGFSSAIKVQMKRGESISLSIRPILGIEVGKVLIKSDTLYVMDKMNRRYLIKNLADISAGLNIDINSIQDMLMNRVFIPNGDITKVKRDFDITQASSPEYWSAVVANIISDLQYQFIFDDMNLVDLNVTMPNENSNPTLNIKYSDFEDSTYGVIASTLYATMVVGTKSMGVNVTVTPSSIVYDSEFTEEFKIGSNYTQMSGSSLLSLLKRAM